MKRASQSFTLSERLAEIKERRKDHFRQSTAPFLSGTEKAEGTSSNFHPGPGTYQHNLTAFKTKFAATEYNSSGQDDDPSFYYVVENGNFQKKVQPYASNRLNRFRQNKAQRAIPGPGQYKVPS